jgi:glycosyltransferase 2 family protein
MNSPRRVLFALLRVALGISVLVYLVHSGAITRRALFGLASEWPLTLAALFLLFLAVVLTAWRLSVLLKPHELHLPLGLSVRLTLMGTFFNFFLLGSGGGDLVKFFYMTRENHGRKTELVTIGLFDRAVGMFALLVWPLLMAPLFPVLVLKTAILRKLLWSAAIVALAMLVGMLVCFSRRMESSRLLSWVFEKLPWSDYLRRVLDTVRGYRHHVGTLGSALLIALATHTLTIGATLLIARATHPGGNFWPASLLVPLGFMANTLPLTPGGLGVGEAAFSALFGLVGLKGGADALLGWRLLTILIGLPGLLVYLQGRRRFVYSSAEKFRPFAIPQSEDYLR